MSSARLPLFAAGAVHLSILDRSRLAPLEGRPAAPAGVEEGDRAGPSKGRLALATIDR